VSGIARRRAAQGKPAPRSRLTEAAGRTARYAESEATTMTALRRWSLVLILALALRACAGFAPGYAPYQGHDTSGGY
jgi:hypothetical protein